MAGFMKWDIVKFTLLTKKVPYQSMPYHPDMTTEISAVRINTGCPTGGELKKTITKGKISLYEVCLDAKWYWDSYILIICCHEVANNYTSNSQKMKPFSKNETRNVEINQHESDVVAWNVAKQVSMKNHESENIDDKNSTDIKCMNIHRRIQKKN